MSAFVVSTEHVNALIARAVKGDHYGPLKYYHAGDWHDVGQDPDAAGQMLTDANVDAVGTRYEDADLTDLPGSIGAEYLIPFKFDRQMYAPPVVESLKLINCYEYQASELNDWHDSEAKSFCDALTHKLIGMLPGYDEAPWAYDERVTA